MTAPARQDAFQMANPHALATILEASETKRIIASRDIFDLSGIKLWARDQPVSSALQRRLMDRQLLNPLETCLMAEDGVTPLSLLHAALTLVESDTPLSALLAAHGQRVAEQVPYLPLHSVVQLLLTATQASRPQAFDHAVQAMTLAGALMVGHGGSLGEIRLAMLAGLLHDLGEMYIDPRFGEADADRDLDFTSYQQLVVHPHVGQLLITQLTNYPATIARAVGEHHERLDGSGYPHALRRDALSPLGRLLAVTETALAVLRGDRPHLARASVALRVVPGEFDLVWTGRVAEAARSQPGRCRPCCRPRTWKTAWRAWTAGCSRRMPMPRRRWRCPAAAPACAKPLAWPSTCWAACAPAGTPAACGAPKRWPSRTPPRSRRWKTSCSSACAASAARRSCAPAS